MKVALFLAVVAVATAQYYGRYGGSHGGGFRPSHGGGGGFRPSFGGVSGGFHDVAVDYRSQSSDYHFSWRHDGGQKYEWGPANRYCASLGHGWQGISIENYDEDALVDNIIAQNKLDYIWTGGSRNSYGWSWPSGGRFTGFDWSKTGGDGHPQPDNREDGKEFCLAVLNHFYQDGITWHDVACHHLKPIICERRRTYG